MPHTVQSLVQYLGSRWPVAIWASLLLLTQTPSVLAHGGHGDEFQSDSPSSAGAIKVDAATAKRMALTVAPVRLQSLGLNLKATGQIEALSNGKVEVTTPIRGTLTQFLVQPGDAVQAGQPVAVLTSPEIAELRIDAIEKRLKAEADLSAATADLNLAQQNVVRQRQIAAADLQQAQSQLSFAQEKYRRDRDLLKVGAIPRRQTLETETQLMQAKSVVAKSASRLNFLQAESQLQKSQSEFSLAQSRIQLSNAVYQARLEQLGADANPNGTITIRAAIAGTVADQDATLGQSSADPGDPIMTIISDRSVLATANIYEKDLSEIRVGQPVKITVTSLPNRTFSGRIRTIGSAVEGETRVVPVKAELDNPNGLLKPGMFAELNLRLEGTSAAVLTVPQSAIVETNQQTTVVFVQNGDAYQPVEVSLGKVAEGWVEIQHGLFEGDRVVVQRATQLYAQSLRGGTAQKQEPIAAPNAALGENLRNLALPGWSVMALGGAALIGTFCAGSYSAKQGDRKKSVRASEGNSFDINSFQIDVLNPASDKITNHATTNHAITNHAIETGLSDSHYRANCQALPDLPQPEALPPSHQEY